MKTINIVAAIPYHGSYEEGDFIAVDSGAKQLIDRNIKFNLIIGDLDSIDEASLIYLKVNEIERIKLNPIKDATDLEYALEYVQDKYDIINVYGALGKRVDHTLTNLNLLKKYPKIKLYDDYSQIYVLNKGEHKAIKNEYQFISFYPIKEGYLDLINFKYPLDKYPLKTDDTLCVSNEKNENAVIKNTEDIIVIESK